MLKGSGWTVYLIKQNIKIIFTLVCSVMKKKHDTVFIVQD